MYDHVEKKHTILVVDDTPVNLELLGSLLGGIYRIKIANSGERALKILEDQELPDLILLDVLMPGLLGWDICINIKSNPKLKDIPVIFLTSKVEIEDEKKGFELGAVDYISKPINPVTLLARVKTHLHLKDISDFLKENKTVLELEVKNRTNEILRQEKELQNLGKLKRFFSESVANQILLPGGDDLLKPHRREIAVVFCDLRGFTHIVAEAEPEEVMRILGDYHQLVGAQVNKYQGTLEHFEGDGIMIFFNDPIIMEDFSIKAIHLAQEIQKLFVAIQEKWLSHKFEIGLGIGVARGYATLGMIGYEGRVDYAAIGTVTNLAARLSGQARDGEILMDVRSFSTLKPSSEIKNAGLVTLKGFTKPTEVYKIERASKLVDRED